ncbi:capsular polysaccharide synthesis protein [bacterium]|nr:capsular polysaccharide synthesis protein [bacterium]
MTRIPKCIYTYWDTTPPPLVSACLESMRQRSGCKVVVLNKETAKSMLALPDNFDTLNPALQSDYVGVYVISKFGGVWMDASCAVFASLEQVFDFESSLVQGWGQPVHPSMSSNVMEAWCFASPRNHSLLSKWATILHNAAPDVEKYCKRIKRLKLPNKPWSSYFMAYLAQMDARMQTFKSNKRSKRKRHTRVPPAIDAGIHLKSSIARGMPFCFMHFDTSAGWGSFDQDIARLLSLRPREIKSFIKITSTYRRMIKLKPFLDWIALPPAKK